MLLVLDFDTFHIFGKTTSCGGARRTFDRASTHVTDEPQVNPYPPIAPLLGMKSRRLCLLSPTRAKAWSRRR